MKLYRWDKRIDQGGSGTPMPVAEVPFSVVPWCAEHNRPMWLTRPICDMAQGCRLEDPPRHIRLEG